MAIELATKYLPYVDELFAKESKRDMLTNQDFSWEGAEAVRIYKISTSEMNDYSKYGTGSWYGPVKPLNATTEFMKLRKDRSFTFAIDARDIDETGRALEGASALARQLREVVIPEVDTWVYAQMTAGAGTKPAAVKLTATNIYDEIIKASSVLDDALVPETGRVLTVIPDVYLLMKKSKDITMETDIGNEMRVRGIVATIDGAAVVKIASARMPEDFGFMLAHPAATVAPLKLEVYNIHENPPGINGQLVEGRIVYDAFVMENKAKAIYYQAQPTE